MTTQVKKSKMNARLNQIFSQWVGKVNNNSAYMNLILPYLWTFEFTIYEMIHNRVIDIIELLVVLFYER